MCACMPLIFLTIAWAMELALSAEYSCVPQSSPLPLSASAPCACPAEATYSFGLAQVHYKVPTCTSFNTTSNLFYGFLGTKYPAAMAVSPDVVDTGIDGWASTQCQYHCLGSTSCNDFMEDMQAAAMKDSPMFYVQATHAPSADAVIYYVSDYPMGYASMSQFVFAHVLTPCPSLSDNTLFEYNHHTGLFNQDNHKCYYYPSTVVNLVAQRGAWNCTRLLTSAALEVELLALGFAKWDSTQQDAVVYQEGVDPVDPVITWDCYTIVLDVESVLCQVTYNISQATQYHLVQSPIPLTSEDCAPGTNFSTSYILEDDSNGYVLDEITQSGNLWHAGYVSFADRYLTASNHSHDLIGVLSNPQYIIESITYDTPTDVTLPFPVCPNNCGDLSQGAKLEIPGLVQCPVPQLSELSLAFSLRRSMSYGLEVSLLNLQDGIYQSTSHVSQSLTNLAYGVQGEFSTVLNTLASVGTTLLDEQESETNTLQEQVDMLSVNNFVNQIRIAILMSYSPPPGTGPVLKISNSTYFCTPVDCQSQNPLSCIPSSHLVYIQGMDTYYSPDSPPPGTLPSIISSITSSSNFSSNAYSDLQDQVRNAQSQLSNQSTIIFSQLAYLQDYVVKSRNDTITLQFQVEAANAYLGQLISNETQRNFDRGKSVDLSLGHLRLGVGLGLGLGIPLLLLLVLGGAAICLARPSK